MAQTKSLILLGKRIKKILTASEAVNNGQELVAMRENTTTKNPNQSGIKSDPNWYLIL